MVTFSECLSEPSAEASWICNRHVYVNYVSLGGRGLNVVIWSQLTRWKGQGNRIGGNFLCVVPSKLQPSGPPVGWLYIRTGSAPHQLWNPEPMNPLYTCFLLCHMGKRIRATVLCQLDIARKVPCLKFQYSIINISQNFQNPPFISDAANRTLFSNGQPFRYPKLSTGSPSVFSYQFLSAPPLVCCGPLQSH